MSGNIPEESDAVIIEETPPIQLLEKKEETNYRLLSKNDKKTKTSGRGSLFSSLIGALEEKKDTATQNKAIEENAARNNNMFPL